MSYATEPGLSSRGVTFAAHTFAAWTRADPEVVWTALTDPGQTPEFLYGLAADSTWIPGAPLRFRCGGEVQVCGRVLCVQRNQRLSYVLQSLPADPPVYLTWLIRPGPGGCTIRLQIDEIDTADSLQDAEDIWLPVLEALQQLVNPGSLPEAGMPGQVWTVMIVPRMTTPASTRISRLSPSPHPVVVSVALLAVAVIAASHAVS
jgi:uncharacterized protein YndB with AHSA1/START domain